MREQSSWQRPLRYEQREPHRRGSSHLGPAWSTAAARLIIRGALRPVAPSSGCAGAWRRGFSGALISIPVGARDGSAAAVGRVPAGGRRLPASRRHVRTPQFPACRDAGLCRRDTPQRHPGRHPCQPIPGGGVM